jgi:hypothetical protein
MAVAPKPQQENEIEFLRLSTDQLSILPDTIRAPNAAQGIAHQFFTGVVELVSDKSLSVVWSSPMPVRCAYD